MRTWAHLLSRRCRMSFLRAIAISATIAIPTLGAADPVKMSTSAICHCPGGAYYARADGSFITEVIGPMDGPNGIGLSTDGAELYVAETHCGRLWAFEIDGPGKVKRTRGPVPWERGRLVAAPAGYHLFDSLAVDSDGNICVGSLPNAIDVFSADGKAEESIAMPDIFPTNICFGGPDLQTAYITLSASGVLASMQWPRPGLALHFLNR